MKTTSKFVLIALVAALGFYNIQIDKQKDSGISLSMIENIASADSETGAPRKVHTKQEESGSNTNTMSILGKLCVTTYDFHTINCIGTGTISCTEKDEKTNVVTKCS